MKSYNHFRYYLFNDTYIYRLNKDAVDSATVRTMRQRAEDCSDQTVTVDPHAWI